MQEEYNKGKNPGESIGRSSAASLVIAEQLASEHPCSIILAICYDKGDRYGDPVVDVFDEALTIPPADWQQDVAVSPSTMAPDLRMAYLPIEDIQKANLQRMSEKLPRRILV